MVLNIADGSLAYIPHERFGFWTGYTFAINSTIGAGFLSIPWAFDSAGWLFSLIYQIVVTTQNYFLSMQLLEAMSRAEILMRITEEGKDIHGISFKKIFFTPRSVENLIQPSHLKPTITNRIISLPDITKMVFGEKIGLLYMIVFGLGQLGTMAAYASIFSSSFASNVPLGTETTCDIYKTTSFYSDCRWKYWIYLLIFGVFTVYMSVKGIEEQQIIQIIMSVLRFVVMFAIIITCLIDITMHRYNENDHYNDAKWPPLIVGKNIGHAIPIILFASTYQISIASISSPINNKTRNLPIINTLTIITCFIFYTCIGIVASLAIDNVPSLASLSYRNYTAGYSKENRPFWTYIFEYIIIITPALDVFSSYPLQAITIANAIISWKYKGYPEEAPKIFLIFIRFSTAFIPLFVTFFVYDLGSILDWVGLSGFIIVQITIPLLHIALRHMIAGKSPYDINIHPIISLFFVLINSILFFLVIIFNLFY